MKTKTLMTKNVKCISTEKTLRDAAQLMWEHNFGCLPVVDKDNKVVAMLTDRDIAMAAFINGKALDAIPISTAQSKQLVYCRADDDINDVELLMQEHQLHRIPVINNQSKAVGIISLNDIANAYQNGKQGIASEDISNTLGAICNPVHHTRGERIMA